MNGIYYLSLFKVFCMYVLNNKDKFLNENEINELLENYQLSDSAEFRIYEITELGGCFIEWC